MPNLDEEPQFSYMTARSNYWCSMYAESSCAALQADLVPIVISYLMTNCVKRETVIYKSCCWDNPDAYHADIPTDPTVIWRLSNIPVQYRSEFIATEP